MPTACIVGRDGVMLPGNQLSSATRPIPLLPMEDKKQVTVNVGQSLMIDFHNTDRTGHVITSISDSSHLSDMISVGDRIIKLNDTDVSSISSLKLGAILNSMKKLRRVRVLHLVTNVNVDDKARVGLIIGGNNAMAINSRDNLANQAGAIAPSSPTKSRKVTPNDSPGGGAHASLVPTTTSTKHASLVPTTTSTTHATLVPTTSTKHASLVPTMTSTTHATLIPTTSTKHATLVPTTSTKHASLVPTTTSTTHATLVPTTTSTTHANVIGTITAVGSTITTINDRWRLHVTQYEESDGAIALLGTSFQPNGHYGKAIVYT